MRLTGFAICLGAALLASCATDVANDAGTNPTPIGDGLDDAVRATRATWQVIDLTDGSVSSAASLPGLASDPAYRDRLLALRRVEGRSAVGQPNASFARQDDETFSEVDVQPCYIAACELTRAQWRRIAGTEPWAALLPVTAAGDDLPATGMSFTAATGALAAWSRTHSIRVSLPNQAQWQAAARGGTRTTFPWGELRSAAVVREHAVTWDTGGQTGPLAVMGRQSNPLGLFDVCGNVWEFTNDGLIHGGSWNDARSLARPANSAEILPDYGHETVGLRLMFLP